MYSWYLEAEAKKCRDIAAEFTGRPEGPFLLNVASAFEELALTTEKPRGHTSAKHR